MQINIKYIMCTISEPPLRWSAEAVRMLPPEEGRWYFLSVPGHHWPNSNPSDICRGASRIHQNRAGIFRFWLLGVKIRLFLAFRRRIWDRESFRANSMIFSLKRLITSAERRFRKYVIKKILKGGSVWKMFESQKVLQIRIFTHDFNHCTITQAKDCFDEHAPTSPHPLLLKCFA